MVQSNVSIKDNNNEIIDLKEEDNLILQTLLYLKEYYPNKLETKGLKIEVKLNYPLNRGLGSSANAIIATLSGVNKLFDLTGQLTSITGDS